MGSGASVQRTKKVYLDISGKEVSVGWRSETRLLLQFLHFAFFSLRELNFALPRMLLTVSLSLSLSLS